MAKRPAKLTVKQAKFVAAKAQGKSGIQAYKEAYETDNDKVASVEASRLLAKPSIKEALAPILAKHQIDLDTALAPIGKGLKATKFNEFTGEQTEDLKIQMQASDRALKLLGVKLDEPQGNTYNFVQVIQDQKDKYAD